MSKVEIDCVPTEILSLIFSHLDFHSKRVAAMVSHKWHEASLDVNLIKNTKLCFDARMLMREDADKNIFFMRSPHVTITNLDDNLNTELFFKSKSRGTITGSHVKTLSLQNCSIHEETIKKLIEDCHNLKGLSVKGCGKVLNNCEFNENQCSDKFRKVMAGLCQLEVCGNLHDVALTRLFQLAPNISSISLPISSMVFGSSSSVYDSYSRSRYGGGSVGAQLTFNKLLDLIGGRLDGNDVGERVTVREINLSQTSIDDDDIEKLVTSPNVCLDKIFLRNCKQLTSEGVWKLCKHQPQLACLDLNGCTQIDDNALLHITASLHRITSLNMRMCPQLNLSQCGRNLRELSCVEALDFSECYHIDAARLVDCLKQAKTLTRLDLKSCNMSRLKKILPNREVSCEEDKQLSSVHLQDPLFINLRHLNVSSSNQVDDETFQLIAINFTKLESLDVSWCCSLTDAGLLGLPLDQQKEEYDDETMDWIMENGRGITRMTGLTSLNLSNCSKLTPLSLRNVFRHKSLCELRRLDLAMLKNAVDNAVVYTLSHNCKNINKLNLQFCNKITDAALNEISKNLSSLSSLKLSNCHHITNEGVMGVATRCGWLRTLDVCMCLGVTSSDIRHLGSMLPPCVRLHARYSGGEDLMHTLTI